MRKLLALLILFAAPAFGASVTLSTGASCEYAAITVATNGAAFVSCNPPDYGPPSTGGGTGTPTPPPAPPVGGIYAPAGMWVYGQNRVSTGIMVAGQFKDATFTIPSGYTGTPEIGISGQNLKVFVDGVEVADGPIPWVLRPGPHGLRITATGNAEGSVQLYH